VLDYESTHRIGGERATTNGRTAPVDPDQPALHEGALIGVGNPTRQNRKCPPNRGSPNSSRLSDTSCGIGDVRAVRRGKEGGVLAAFSKKALDEFDSAAVAHDNEGIDQLVNARKLTELPNGNRLRVLDFQGLLAQTTEARVLTDPDPRNRGQLVSIDGCSPPLGPKLG